MLAPQLLQGLGVGGVSGLGALDGGETEIVEEHLGQLLGRVDVDGASGVDQHLLPQLLGLGVEFVADLLQHRPVHADADVLHAGQHPHQRHLHVVVEAVQTLRGQRFPEGSDQAVDGQSGPSRLLVGLDGAAVEVQPSLRRDVGGRVYAGVAAGEVAEVVAGVGRIQEVGGQHGVDQRVSHLDAAGQQRAHEVLGAVRGQWPARARIGVCGSTGDEPGERGRDLLVVQQPAGQEGHPALGRVDHPGQAGLEPPRRGGQRQGRARRCPPRPRLPGPRLPRPGSPAPGHRALASSWPGPSRWHRRRRERRRGPRPGECAGCGTPGSRTACAPPARPPRRG